VLALQVGVLGEEVGLVHVTPDGVRLTGRAAFILWYQSGRGK